MTIAEAVRPAGTKAEPVAPDARGRSLRAALSADQRLGRAFLQGSLAGGLVVFLFCGGIAWWAGLGLWGAIGIGAFTALWGGPGFGGMMGATVYYSSHVDDF